MFARLCLAAALVTTVFAAAAPSARAQVAEDRPAAGLGQPVIDASLPRVALRTNQGDIVLQLRADRAPATVENFLQYVRDGHYNGTILHRGVPDALLQGGKATPDLQAKPVRAPVVHEARDGLSNLRGTVALARRARVADSGTSEFFINVVDNPRFDWTADAPAERAGYTVFAEVIEGMDVVDRWRALPTSELSPQLREVPTPMVVIERAEILAPGTPAAPTR